MTIIQLRELLKEWPGNAQVEMSVSYEDDPIWFEIAGVEQTCEDQPNDHCLLYSGKVTME